MLTKEQAAIAKENSPEYTDCYYKPTALTSEEQKFFWETVAKVLSATEIQIPVYMCDHEKLPGKNEDALGLHWKNADGDEFITIDNYFIHECYEVAFNGAYSIDNEDLVSVLCHELAHIRYQRHSRYHEELTEKYIAVVKEAN